MSNPIITITGNLVREPEVRFTPGGHAVASFSVATNDRKKQGDEWVDGDTSYWECSAWRDLAEAVAELAKGAPVIVVGKLKQRSFETREGQKRTVTEIDVETVGIDMAVQARRGKHAGTQAPRAAANGGDPWGAQAAAPAAQRDPWAAGEAPF